MISPEFFVKSLAEMQMNFFAGVPDSLLKSLCAYITDHVSEENHIIVANEGNAIGVAAGYHLTTRKIPVVYMQNSGEGNAINPLLSLIDKEVYHIPLLLLIGWRGEPNTKDEPQHVKQGKVTIPLLEAMAIKYAILSFNQDEVLLQLKEAKRYMEETGEPWALIVRRGVFADYTLNHVCEQPFSLLRETAVQLVASSMNEEDVIVSTTGMISRELFEYRETLKQRHDRDFLTVGSMGHASQIALGIALQQKRRIYCFDGDGAVLMHMGGLALIGTLHPSNFVHIVFNNGAHDSVGGQPTVGLKVNLAKVAKACGYAKCISVSEEKSLRMELERIKTEQGPVFLEIKVRKGARKDLGRPTRTPKQNKEDLMDLLQDR